MFVSVGSSCYIVQCCHAWQFVIRLSVIAAYEGDNKLLLVLLLYYLLIAVIIILHRVLL